MPERPGDGEALEVVLSEQRGSKVTIVVPLRGEKRDLLELAHDNAKHTLMRFKVRTRYDEERLNAALLQLESALALPAPPLRIEAFDISTLHGTHSVASMVVFAQGRPESKSYRRFKVRLDSAEANDVAMMTEVLRRRFAPERMADGRFGARPASGDRRRRQAAAQRRARRAGRVLASTTSRSWGLPSARRSSSWRGPTIRWCCLRGRPRSTW